MHYLHEDNKLRADGDYILVVDDEPMFRTMVVRSLRALGYTVLEADRAEEALETACGHAPALVVSDVFMGGMTGIELLAGLRANPAAGDIPVILMTGDPTEAGVRRCMESGADDYLIKPFAVDDLARSVAAQLEKRRRTRQHEQEIEARLLAILDATTDMVGMIDFETRRSIYLNDAGRAMIGLGRDEDISSTHLSDFHSDSALKHIETEAFPTAVRDGVWRGESSIRRRDGAELVVSQVILAHKGAGGEIRYLSTIARDITRRKSAERERALMEIQLRHAQKLESIGQLAAGIAHEINTPTQYLGDNIRFLRDAFASLETLTPLYARLRETARQEGVADGLLAEIEAGIEAVDANYLAAEIPQAIEQALEGVERVTKIVGAMKDFSHPGSQEREPVDINRAIESTLTVSRNEWKYCADLVTHLDPLLPRVPCLPGEFNQVILNLVINAAHAISDVVGEEGDTRGMLTVTTRRDADWVEVRVQDTGSGIPEHVRDRIFDPFFTTKPVGKGTGQGLSIARSVVVDKHGGTLHFETETGRGTTFVVRLPLNPSLHTRTCMIRREKEHSIRR